MEILGTSPELPAIASDFSVRHKIRTIKRLTGHLILASLLLLLALPSELLAIHAIIKDKDPIPRVHGPLTLGMGMEDFLKSVTGTEVKAAIGQFEDEARFQLNRLLFGEDVEGVLSDFYFHSLFRIEVNYKPLKKETALFQILINRWTEKYGAPRENVLPGVRLLFWDDGATRMILEIDELEDLMAYSVTFIDDDLFHKASRDRVQRETAGASSYGK